jgi:dihydroxyacetone kinase-like protein
MADTAAKLPSLIQAAANAVNENAAELTLLDQAIGDGDHVDNLKRGLQALTAQTAELAKLDWPGAFQKMGMTVMTSVGGASGSLYGTLFMAMGKSLPPNQPLGLPVFADAFAKAVAAVGQRGKAARGEKTMLDVLIPVSEELQKIAANGSTDVYEQIKQAASAGAEATRDMIATKGRASFLGERSKGHIDAGAKSSQVMIGAVADTLAAG